MTLWIASAILGGLASGVPTASRAGGAVGLCRTRPAAWIDATLIAGGSPSDLCSDGRIAVGGAHRRKSRRFTAPTGGPPTIAFVDTHPLRTGRAAEALLLSCLISDVHGDWLIMSGAVDMEQIEAGYQLTAGLVGPILMKEMDALFADKNDEELQYQGLVPTILWAATRWICALDLPHTAREVWEGPPLRTRSRTGPPGHPSVARGG
jgi:hypothetical protein